MQIVVDTKTKFAQILAGCDALKPIMSVQGHSNNALMLSESRAASRINDINNYKIKSRI